MGKMRFIVEVEVPEEKMDKMPEGAILDAMIRVVDDYTSNYALETSAYSTEHGLIPLLFEMIQLESPDMERGRAYELANSIYNDYVIYGVGGFMEKGLEFIRGVCAEYVGNLHKRNNDGITALAKDAIWKNFPGLDKEQVDELSNQFTQNFLKNGDGGKIEEALEFVQSEVVKFTFDKLIVR